MYSSKILLNQQQIEAINWRNLQKEGTGLISICEIESILPEQLEALLKAEKLPQEPRYDKDGNLYGESFYAALNGRIDAAIEQKNCGVRYGVAIDNTFLRLFPTMAGSYRFDELGELDRFAVTLIKLGEPLIIYCQDESGVWSFVQSQQAHGWILTAHLAWEEQHSRWRQYCCDREQLLVADSRRTLEYVDFNGCLQNQLLLMGTKLPLYDANCRTFVIGVPFRDCRGNLAILQTMVQRDGGFIPGPLPLSAQNIISQAKKTLGEPYGWGGSGYYRDCSSLIGDVFSVFGLLFPRNSREQMQMVGIEQCPGNRDQKYAFIANLPAGSVLYFPGHAMLYLGRRENQLEILHSVYAIGLPAQQEVIPHKIKRVVQGNLQQRRANGEQLLDAVTACWIPR